MTITALPVRNEFTALAAQTVFNFTYKIFEDSDLNVYVTPVGQDANDSLDITTNYVIDPSSINNKDGGFLTLNSGTSAGDLITIVSNVPESRTTDYQNNGDFRPETVNDDFDRVVQLTKQTEDRAGRTLAFQDSEQNATSLSLPKPQASMYMRWKLDESGLENTPATSSTLISAEVVGSFSDALAGDWTGIDNIETSSFAVVIPYVAKGGLKFYRDGTTGAPSTAELLNGRFYDATGAGFSFSYRTTYDLYMFGAFGLGVDDTDALRNAFNSIFPIEYHDGDFVIDAANNMGIGDLFTLHMFELPAGKYIKSSVGAKIQFISTTGVAADLFSTIGGDITVEGVHAEGIPYSMNDAANAEVTGGMGHGFAGKKVANFDNITVKFCFFKYCLYGGIGCFSGTTTNVKFKDNIIENVRGHAIAGTSCENIEVTGNVIINQQTFRENPIAGSGETFTGAGIDISDNSNRALVTRNIINGCVFGIKHERDETISSDSSDSIITNNLISEVNTVDYGLTAFAIKAAANRCTVKDNIIFRVKGVGVEVGTGNSESIDITGNKIEQHSNTGIFVFEEDNLGNKVDRILTHISGNSLNGVLDANPAATAISVQAAFVSIDNNKIKDPDFGIVLGGNAHDCDVDNNTIHNPLSDGIFASGADAATLPVTDNDITNNKITMSGDGNNHGIRLLRCDKTSILANRILSLSDSSTARGIFIDSTANDQGEYLISGNRVKNFFRNIQTNNVDDVTVTSNQVIGHGTLDRGINVSGIDNGLVSGNMCKTCNEGIVSGADTANTFVDSNQVASCTTGVTVLNATVGQNV